MIVMRCASALRKLLHYFWQALRSRVYPVSSTSAAIIALLAWSAVFAAPMVTVTNARVRLLPDDLPLAGYFDLTNRGRQPLVLTAASSPWFKMVHLHVSMEKGGISSMAAIEGVTINPGETLHFAPGGYHLMLMQRARILQVGARVPITLKFSDNQSLKTTFEVRSADTP